MKKIQHIIDKMLKADTSTKLVIFPNIIVTITFLFFANENHWYYVFAAFSGLIAFAAYKDI